MKKIFPAILLSTLFVTIFVSQMFINGSELGASFSKSQNQKTSFLELQYKEISGTQFDGSTFDKGLLKRDFVIVNFWASWCIPCIPKLDVLNAVPKKFNVIGINMDDSSTSINAKKIIREKLLKFPNIKDEESSIGNKFLVKTLPFTILFKNGKIIKTFDGSEKFSKKLLIEFFE